ncbi:MAG: hypothetical protein GF350_04040 [Chitinivibrionales bacterium]|nr:hypothetical protein [Chitinivibrionales bacterium]
MNALAEKLQFHTGQPVSGKNADEDILGFSDLGQTVAEYIGSLKEKSAAIGIFGEWGCGKTSLMRIIQDTLNADTEKFKGRTIWFNAWRYDNEKNPVIPLLKTIRLQLARNDDERKRLEKSLSLLEKLAIGLLGSLKMQVGSDLTPVKAEAGPGNGFFSAK